MFVGDVEGGIKGIKKDKNLRVGSNDIMHFVK